MVTVENPYFCGEQMYGRKILEKDIMSRVKKKYWAYVRLTLDSEVITHRGNKKANNC